MNWDKYKEDVHITVEALKTEEISDFVNLMKDAYANERSVFIIGNGGSASAASHLCNDLCIGTLWSKDSNKKRMRAISLTDNISIMTAWANDTKYDHIFDQQLRNLAASKDILVAISGSGNSINVLNAIDYANERDMHTLSITGFDGGKLKKTSKSNIHVPIDDMGMVEAIHGVIFHYIASKLREDLKID